VAGESGFKTSTRSCFCWSEGSLLGRFVRRF